MASIFDRYGIKEVADFGIYEINADGSIGALKLYLDSLKVSTLEQTASQVTANGGKGNVDLVAWDYGKELSLNIEDALYSPQSMNMMFGSRNDIEQESGSDQPMIQVTPVSLNVTKLVNTALFNGSLNGTTTFNRIKTLFNIVNNLTETKDYENISLIGFSNAVYDVTGTIQNDLNDIIIKKDSQVVLEYDSSLSVGKYVLKTEDENLKFLVEDLENETWQALCTSLEEVQLTKEETSNYTPFVDGAVSLSLKSSTDASDIYGKIQKAAINKYKGSNFATSYTENDLDKVTPLGFFAQDEKGDLSYYTIASGLTTDIYLGETKVDFSKITLLDNCIANYSIDVNKKSIITITAQDFPGTYYMIGDTYARSEVTGKDEFFQLIIPKAKISAENNITLQAEGDPTTFSMNITVLRPTDGQMVKLVQYSL